MMGAEGYFLVNHRTLHKRDGSTVKEPILEFYASTELFNCDVTIDDHVVIKHCPMCGGELR